MPPAQRPRRRPAPVHEYVHVAPQEARGRDHHEHRDEERRDRVTLGEAERGSAETREHGQRAGEVAPEVERIREQRVASVPPRRPQRHGGARRVDRDHHHDRRKRPPRCVHLGIDRSGQTRDRDGGDEDAEPDQERRLGERRQMLRLPVAVGMPAVRRADGDRESEEGEQRRSEVGPGVRRLGEQAEAPAREPGHELDEIRTQAAPTETSAMRRCG